MIEVHIQLNKPPTYIDHFVYTGRGEALTVQALQVELPERFRNATRHSLINAGDPVDANAILGFVANQILTHQTGPWKVVLMRDKKILYTLEYALPLLGSEIEEVEIPEVVRVSRYTRTPII